MKQIAWLVILICGILACQPRDLRMGLIETAHLHHSLYALTDDTYFIKACKVYHPPPDTYYEGTFNYNEQIKNQYESYRVIWLGECLVDYTFANFPTPGQNQQNTWAVHFLYLPETMEWVYLSKMVPLTNP